MKPLLIYADTSVFGGCLDEGFAGPSRQLFEEVRSGGLVLIVSETTLLELEGAPPGVQAVLAGVPGERVRFVRTTDEVMLLRNAYLAAGVLGTRHLLDAEHIAAATVAQADLIVSWNFRHIVHYEKIRGFNGVNLLHGYRPMAIHSPLEVIQP